MRNPEYSFVGNKFSRGTFCPAIVHEIWRKCASKMWLLVSYTILTRILRGIQIYMLLDAIRSLLTIFFAFLKSSKLSKAEHQFSPPQFPPSHLQDGWKCTSRLGRGISVGGRRLRKLSWSIAITRVNTVNARIWQCILIPKIRRKSQIRCGKRSYWSTN